MTTKTSATASNVKDETKKGPNQNPTAKSQGLPDFSTWEDEQVGFPPYWSPVEGAWLFGQIVARDDRGLNTEGGFVRYLIKAGMETTCKSGSKAMKTEEDVMIKTGEFFSISVYASLEGLFDFYLESGIMPAIRLQALNKVPTKTGKQVWKWKLQVSPEDKKRLEGERTTRRQLQAAHDAEEFDPAKLEAAQQANQ